MIRLLEDGVSDSEGDEAVEGCCAFRCPDEGHAFLKEVEKGLSNVSKAGDKGAMIPKDAECGSHFFNGFQGPGPLCNPGNFTGVDAESFAIEQEA